MSIISWPFDTGLRPARGELERRVARSLVETQARLFFTSWLEHQVLKTVLKVAALPVTGPIDAGVWMVSKIHEQVEEEHFDEDRVTSRLMELQLRYELGEFESEEEYLEQEKVIMEDLAAIMESKKDERFEPDEAWWRRTFPEAFQGREGDEERKG